MKNLSGLPMDISGAKTPDSTGIENGTRLESKAGSQSILRHWRTFYSTLAAAMSTTNIGMMIGYSSSAFPDINSNVNPFHLNVRDVTLLSSIFCVGALVGQLFSGFVIDKYGRRHTLIFNCLPTVVGWVLIGCSPNTISMNVGRFLTGFGGGISDVATPVYISEISDKSVRGFMGSCHELLMNIGVLYVFALGIFVHWNWLAIGCASVPVVNAFWLLLVPESPRWLLANGLREEAMSALLWLRNESQVDAELDFKEIEENIKTSGSVMSWKECGNKNILKPALVVVGLLFFQQISGNMPILQNMESIFQAAGSNWDPYVQTTVVGLSGVVANMLSCFVVDRAGRRVMLLLSSGAMTFALAGGASFFTLKYCGIGDDILSSLVWLPVFSFVLFNFSLYAGLGPIPFFLSSEILPLRARIKVGSICIATVWFFAFAAILPYQGLLQVVDYFGTIWYYCGFSVLGILFVYFLVPETKGLSLEKLENTLYTDKKDTHVTKV